jgi:hypothetical protein
MRNYRFVRSLLIITSVVFFTQLLLESSGIIVRLPEYWWVIYACGTAFALSLLYAVVVLYKMAKEND